MGDKKPSSKKTNIPSTTKPMIVSIVLDETGSMGVIKDKTISAFNEYVGELKKIKHPVSVSLTKFNSERTEIVYNDKSVKDVALLDAKSYVPNSLTPLYDAVGKTISAVEKVDSKKKSILVVVITDGQENASKEYKREDIFKQITKHQKDDGWTFVFLGADQDAWAAGEKMGLYAGNVMSFASTDIKDTMRRTARATMSYAMSSNRMTGGSTVNFFNNTSTKK